jgi:hypothetical protein
MLIELRLEARDDSRNCRRAYSIRVWRDLLGDLVVEITNGRIGAAGPGTRHVYVVADEAAAKRLVANRLRRRASAPRRIGVEYKVVAARDQDGAVPFAWVAALSMPARRTVAKPC